MTETSVPTPVTGKSVSMMFTDYTWLAHHVVLFILAVIICVGAVYETDNIISKRDDANSTKWNSILQTQTEQTAALQKQIAAEEQADATRDAQYQKTIAQLAQSISVRNTQVAQQVKNDAALSTQEAAVRLATQTQAAPGEVVAQGPSILLDLPIARSVIGSLDLLPVAQANLADTEKQLASQQGLTADAMADDQKQKQLVVGLQGTNLDQGKACLAEVSALKAKNRKNILKAVGIGIGVGIGIALKWL